MAKVTDLAAFINAYGTAVRAGVVTPQSEDEVYVRDLFGLPTMGEAASSLWQETGGVRRPITLVKDDDLPPPNAEQTDENSDSGGTNKP